MNLPIILVAAAMTWPLCHDGHPAKRPPDCFVSNVDGCVSYGGLARRKGFERDHFVPEGLCRGQPWCDVAVEDPGEPPGPDNVGNVWYELYPEASEKDKIEWEYEDKLCAGEFATPEDAIKEFLEDPAVRAFAR